MSWIEPKTDWVASDKYNYQDYNRMVGNMKELVLMTDMMFKPLNVVDMPTKANYTSRLSASEFNALENNLELINASSYKLNIGATKTYATNDKTPNFAEFNRIEQAQKNLYDRLIVQMENARHLAIELPQKSLSYREV